MSGQEMPPPIPDAIDSSLPLRRSQRKRFLSTSSLRTPVVLSNDTRIVEKKRKYMSRRLDDETDEEYLNRLTDIEITKRLREQNSVRDDVEVIVPIQNEFTFTVDNQDDLEDNILLEIEGALQAIRWDEQEIQLEEQATLRDFERAREIRNEIATRVSRHVRQLPDTHLVAARPFLNDAVPICNIGNMNSICILCNARHFAGEMPSDGRMSLCCDKGRVRIPARIQHPDLLQLLCTGQDEEAKIFRKHILYINNSLAFASFKAKVTNLQVAYNPNRPLPGVLHVNGIIHHMLHDVTTADDIEGGQYYCFQTDEATDLRLNETRVDTLGDDREIVGEIIRKLDLLVREINPFAEAHRMLFEVYNEVERQIISGEMDRVSVHLRIFHDRAPETLEQAEVHIGRLNMPTRNQVCGIFTVDSNCNVSQPYDLRVYFRDDRTRRSNLISSVNPNRDPLIYPLIFARGEQTFRLYMPRIFTSSRHPNVRTTVSHLEYYSYLLHNRGEFNSVLQSDKLTQQFIIDAWVNVETDRLNFQRTDDVQRMYRRATVQGLNDYIAGDDILAAVVIPEIDLVDHHHNVNEHPVVPANNDDDQLNQAAEEEEEEEEEIENIRLNHFDQQFRNVEIVEDIHPEYVANVADELESEDDDPRPPRPLPGSIVTRLGSDFVGSKQNRTQNFQDAMALVTELGKPYYFLTFSCNPKWTEIVDELQGADYESRPDIVTRVFNLKLKEFLKDLKENSVLGRVIALVYTIEFQKRSLPHAHIVVWISPEDKPRNGPALDKFICAEIPDRAANQQLFREIYKMIHGPCGPGYNTQRACVKGGQRCDKYFPKQFQQDTLLEEFGYPKYRRRPNQQVVYVGGKRIDNRWIVPYNPYLLLRYGSHINIEQVANLRSLKYLFKYILKGCDMINIETQQQIAEARLDEVTRYELLRYVDAVEASWRLFKFTMHYNSFTVYRLAVHLPDQQMIVYAPHDDLLNERYNDTEDGIPETIVRDTMLTAYFDLNATDENARQYMYKDIPRHYTYQSDISRWTLRVRITHTTIGRMYFVPPDKQELYCLKKLLLTVRGATSYAHLRTVNGIEYGTFTAAASALGLITDDNQLHLTMEEATNLKLPRQLRYLFAQICIFCRPSNEYISRLYNHFLNDLIEDFTYRNRYSREDSIKLTLNHLNQIFIRMGHSNFEFGLEIPPANLPTRISEYANLDAIDIILDIETERNELDANLALLNVAQKTIYEKTLLALSGNGDNRKLYFIDGPGGSGKTFLYNCIIGYCLVNQISFMSVAYTGIAASLLKRGRTLHSLFRMPIDIDDQSVCNIPSESGLARDIINTRIIVWDEISMCQKRILEMVDLKLRELMCNDEPFGGKIIILGGDFRQCLPIIPRGDRSIILAKCPQFAHNHLWWHFEQLQLWQNVRITDATETDFMEWLLKIGNNEINDIPSTPLYRNIVNLPNECVISNNDICAELYGNPIENIIPDRMVLTPLNRNVDRFNRMCMDRMSNNEYVEYYSDDSVKGENADYYDIPYLNSIKPTGFPEHHLRLKLNCPIMLMKNINPSAGLCNGTRLIVEKLDPHLITAKIVSGSHIGQRTFIARIPWIDKSLDYEWERVQFPVRVCFAMTINKSQGQTFNIIGLYLEEPVFSHGQLYVALSRVRSRNGLKIRVRDTEHQGVIIPTINRLTYTPNIVYDELFRVQPPPNFIRP